MSNTIVVPSGETSTDIHVPSVVSNVTCFASARGVLMSAAASFGFAGSAAAGFGPPSAVEATRHTAARAAHPERIMRSPVGRRAEPAREARR